MFFLISILIAVAVVIALFVFPELRNLALNLVTRLLRWDGILLIIAIIFIVFFMYAKQKQLENKQMELQAVVKQEELKQERLANAQISREMTRETSADLQKQVTPDQPQPKTTPVPSEKETEPIQDLVNYWRQSWESGDFVRYRTFYAADFQSKGKNLDAWVSYKTDVSKKSKGIKIGIDNLQITLSDHKATAVFTQHYSSSLKHDSGKKTLQLKKENNEWKIYGEMM